MFIPQPNFTQAPNVLFDEWLPLLTHVELKVLMVIMRKTFGWHKIRDQISLSQLEKYTGSKRSNIITAAENLQKLGLILKQVIGKQGEQETYYELIIKEDSNNSYQSHQGTPPSPTAGPTKETLTKEKSPPPPSSKETKLDTPPTKAEEEEIQRRIKERPKESPKIKNMELWRKKVLSEIRQESQTSKANLLITEKHAREAKGYDMQKFRGFTAVALTDRVEFTRGSHLLTVPYDCSDEAWNIKVLWKKGDV